MKPAFALSLSDNGITLLHYSDGEWFGIGTVSLEGPEFSEKLNDLRAQAFALENDLSCTVVIPPEQVRHLSIEADEKTDDGLAHRVETELTKVTACDVGDLIYDLRREGSEIHVAAVTRETITEARAFASQHGFVPVRFVTASANGTWPGAFEFQFIEPALAPKTSDTPRTTESTVESEETAGLAPSEEAVEPPPAKTAISGPKAHPIAEPAAPDVFVSMGDLPQGVGKQPNSLSAWKPQRYAVGAVAIAVMLGLTAGIWALMAPSDSVDTIASAPVIETPERAPVSTPPSEEPEQTAEPETAQNDTPDPEAVADEELMAETSPAAVQPDLQTPPELTATDAAILEALNVAPSPVAQVARDPESQEVFQEVTGLATTAPDAPPQPPQEGLDEIYLSTVDRVGLSQDPVALPDVQSFETDDPIGQAGLPSVAGNRFNLDERGLVAATPEGTLNPDGIIVFLGRPSSVPPEVPVRFETEPAVSEADSRLAGLRPRGRPSSLIENFERGQLGGRSAEELAIIRPKARPKSVQERTQVEQSPTALAVVRVPRPRVRPSTVAALAARKSNADTAKLGSTAAVANAEDEADSFHPKTVAPKIPTTASVARQATMDNALNLRRLNLIGVYGTPSNRRALVRLPSGRYKKLKVGDRIDGGNVIAIGDSELRYQKRGKNVTLKMPRS